ncbi:MAG TPA: condensation domain-containing protein, partial [Mycobacteriales bacterium]|nr:condensation domain-containing protein [Mycobacteriales bacterium]
MIPLSYAQERLWFLRELEGPGSAYHVPMALRLRGRLDRAALAAALGDVLARHEALRTVFPTRDGQPVQQVLPAPARFQLTRTEVTEAELPGALASAAARPFDLS